MIGKKIIEVLNDYKLTNANTLPKQINELDWEKINQINKAINDSSISIEDASKSISENEFNLLVNRNLSNSPNLNKFVKKSILYSDKLVVYNELGILLEATPKGYDLNFIKEQLHRRINELMNFIPLIENDLLHLVKPDDFFKKFSDIIKNINQRDLDNEELKALLTKSTILGVPENDPQKFYMGVGTKFILMAQAVIQGRGTRIDFILPKRVMIKPLNIIENDEPKKRTLSDLYSLILNDLNSDLLLCDYLKSNYLTNEELEWNLIHNKIGLNKTNPVYPAIMSLDLKFLDNVSYESIIKIREKLGSSFEDFRVNLSEYVKDIKDLPFTKDFQKKVNELKERSIEPEIRKLDRTFNTMFTSRLIKMSSIAIGTLLATMLTGSYAAFISGEVALAHQGAEIKKDMLQLRNNPMYFLWKIKSR